MARMGNSIQYRKNISRRLALIVFALAFSLLFVSSVSAGIYFEIKIINTTYGVEISQVYVIRGIMPQNHEGDYEYNLYSFDENLLESRSVKPLNNTIYALFSNKGKIIEIKHGDGMMHYDVGFFTKQCGDGVCQEHETFFACSEDCSSGKPDGYCDKVRDGRCDRDCTVVLDPDCSGDAGKSCNYNRICEENENKVVCPEDCLSSSFCMVLKDGYCDPDCPSIDLDCFCGDKQCQSFENHINCPEDCSSLNYSLFVNEEQQESVPYQFIIPAFILACALLLFFYNELQLKKLKQEEKRS